MLPSGATTKLYRMVMFTLVKDLGRDICYRCNKKIETLEVFSVEHKNAWRREPDPVAAFFDMENISFSHKVCNYSAAHKPNKKYFTQTDKRANWLKQFYKRRAQGKTKVNRSKVISE